MGRIVNSVGDVACTLLGIEAKQVGHSHVDVQEDHSKPGMELHGIATEDTPAQHVFTQQDDPTWSDVQLDWKPFGVGCWKDILCVPQG